MSLELLLSMTCWLSTTVYTESKENACIKAGEAYYVYNHLDEQVKEIERHTPIAIIYTTTLLSSVQKRKASVPIYNGTYFGVEVPDNTTGKITIGFEHGF